MLESSSSNPRSYPSADSSKVYHLVHQLGDENSAVRLNAQGQLLEMSETAIDFLGEALDIGSDLVRWETVKLLSRIAGPKSLALLIRALDDSRDSIRWLAAVGILEFGNEGRFALLRSIINRSQTSELRERMHILLRQAEAGAFTDDLFSQISWVLAKGYSGSELEEELIAVSGRIIAELAATEREGGLAG